MAIKTVLTSIILLFFCTLQLHGQEITVTGTVTSEEEGRPLPGVNVVVEGTTVGTTTGSDGTYSIGVPEEDAVLVFSFLGYETEEVPVEGRTEIDVVLREDVAALAEVVVTAFGMEQQRRELGYAVQNVDVSSMRDTRETNVLNALRGRVAGVNIASSSGAPGAGSSIIIRGINSLNPGADNQPLFVIDGIPVSNETDITGGRGGDAFSHANRFADINPEDIESISILKGPAASSLYGLRAANGAVVITTRSGEAGMPQVSFRSSLGADDVVTRPPMQSTYGRGLGGVFNPEDYRADGPPIPEGEPVYNQWDQIFQTGLTSQQNLSVSGGAAGVTYYTSISRTDQSGVIPEAGYDRTSFRLRGSYEAMDNLTIHGTANYVNSGTVNPRAGVGGAGVMSYASRYAPDVDMSEYRTDLGEQIRYSPSLDNPFFFAENAFQRESVNRLIGTIGVDYRIANWLQLDYRVGLDRYTDHRFRQTPPSLLIGGTGSMAEQTLDFAEINSNLILTTAQQVTSDLVAEFSIGNQITIQDRHDITGSGTGYAVPDFHSINNLDDYTVRAFPSERNIIGLFSDLKLDWQDTIYLNLTGRNDWSSTLPTENRSFFYGSASLGYVFTETLGLPDDHFLSFGKLRASYAEVGKDASPYQIGTYYSTLSPFRGTVGVTRSAQIGSEDLRPERTRGIELGVDLGLLDDRFRIDANYAIETSIDQIVPVPVSRATGYTTYLTNTGELRNTSIELLLDANIIRTDNFAWSTTLNWSRIRGEVVSMPEGLEQIVFQPETPWVKQIIEPGGSPGDWYGWTLSRVEDPESEHYGRLVIVDGYPDVNDNWTGRPLAEDDYIGNAFPDWEGGIFNQVSWGGLELSALVTIRQGGYVFDINRRMRYGFAAGEAPTGAETEMRNRLVVFDGVRNEGTVDNPIWVENDAAVPIDVANLYGAAFRYRLASEFNGFQEASWIRLQNVTLSYTLPSRFFQNSPLSNVRFSVTGNNVWLSTPFVGFDPEQSAYGPGSNVFGYVGTNVPSTRTITFSVDVTL